jgi:tRNA/rRNA methyltransferase
VRLDGVEFVLVRPSRGANVAAACRAMKNMGLRRLVLVDAAAELAEADRALAYGAWDVLEAARREASLAEAVGGASLVVATSGRAQDAWTPRELAVRAPRRARDGRLAVVFGPESSGLTRAELALCHEVVRIPSAAEQPSLNLAQAVLVVAYELRVSAVPAATGGRDLELATAADLEGALLALRSGLVAIGYLNPQNPDALLGELRRLLARASPTPRDVALVRGLARQIGWAGRIVERSKARREEPEEEP